MFLLKFRRRDITKNGNPCWINNLLMNYIQKLLLLTLPKPFSYFLADGFEIRLSSRLSRMFVIGFWLKIFIRTLSWHGIKPYKKIFYWTSTYLWHSRRTSSYEWHLKAFSWNSSILSLQPPRLKAALTLPITANTLPSVPVSLQIGLDVLVGILSPKSN